MDSLNSLHLKILTALAPFPNGIGVKELLENVHDFYSLRSLQRQLKRLIEEKRIAKIGRGKATLYKLAVALKAPDETTSYENYIPISEDSREMIQYLRRPLSARHPVAYDPTLLSLYEPNQTYYLSSLVRSHLTQIGTFDQKERPAGTYGRDLLNRMLIDLSWASSRLEGNTYSRLDTEKLIEFGNEIEGKNTTEMQMILNHKVAIEFLVDEIHHIDFDKTTFLNLHGLLSESLLSDPDASGRLRKRPVDISGSVFKPLAIPQLIEEYFIEILNKAANICDPFEQAFFVMVHIPYLQPFEDVNKRVSRLALNIPLLKHNLCPLTFLDVPDRAYVESMLGVYEMGRFSLLQDLFVWAYERSTREYMEVRKSLVAPDPLRLRYRQYIHNLVREIVSECIVDSRSIIEKFADSKVNEDDRARFIEIVQDDIKRLHEGVLARYRLKPDEYLAWVNARKY